MSTTVVPNKAEIVSSKDDIVTDRPRWMSRWSFLAATVGAAIGVGNVWRFPYLTFKHGGMTFILTYLYALFIVGIPMLILELTLGQKMQKGSAGSMRGIVPRLAGIGYVASFSGFVTALTYNILLGMSIIYLVQSSSEPWAGKNFDKTRSLSCQTAEMMQKPAEEIYLFSNVVKLYGDAYCDVYSDGDPSAFSMPLFWSNLFCWAFCCLILAVGPRAIELKAIVTVPLRFIFIIIFVIKFAGLNTQESGDGNGWYLNGDSFPIPTAFDQPTQFMDFSTANETLFSDAYGQVFFSLGVCFGTMFAYGSYNKTRKPVICDAFLIGIIDFIFSFISGFGVWGGIGYLQRKNNIAYTQSSSVGLIFIAMPAAAVESGYTGTLALLMFTLWMIGIDSAVGFIEAAVTNMVDQSSMKRYQCAIVICTVGFILSSLFCSNWGWVLFDLVDHYISSYIVLPVGLCQCIAVGWIFERKKTASRSPAHAKSMRALTFMYWFPTCAITFYFSFGFQEAKMWGILALLVNALIAFGVSFYLSDMPLNSWYHEIVLCGTDKIAMSISILSNADQSRSWWMLPFEAYFGFLIKYVNPACLLFFIFEGLKSDLAEPFGIVTSGWLPVVASMYVFVAIVIIFAPMLACDYPENFRHNVEKEFSADDIFENKARIAHKMRKKMRKMKEGTDTSKVELVGPSTSKPTDQTERLEDLTNPKEKEGDDEWKV